jgi:hypothetical protein
LNPRWLFGFDVLADRKRLFSREVLGGSRRRLGNRAAQKEILARRSAR